MALKHADIIAQMTLEEKASMCDGLDYWHSQPVERVGIKSISLNDGPHGIRKKGDPEQNKDVLIVVDDALSVAGIDSPELPILKQLVSITKNAKSGSISIIAISFRYCCHGTSESILSISVIGPLPNINNLKIVSSNK